MSVLQIHPARIELPSQVRGRPASRELRLEAGTPMATLAKVMQLQGQQAGKKEERSRAIERWVERKIKHQSIYLNPSSEGEW
jgi:hypothetical protein